MLIRCAMASALLTCSVLLMLPVAATASGLCATSEAGISIRLLSSAARTDTSFNLHDNWVVMATGRRHSEQPDRYGGWQRVRCGRTHGHIMLLYTQS